MTYRKGNFILYFNLASDVPRPRYSCTEGKTPGKNAEKASKILASIGTER